MKDGIPLYYLRKILEKYRIQTIVLHREEGGDPRLDFGIRSRISGELGENRFFSDVFSLLKENTVYRMTDALLCSYIFLLLPDTWGQILSIGPYLSVEPTREQLMENAEHAGIPPGEFRKLEEYYASVPVALDSVRIFGPLEVFCEEIWGGESGYTVTDLNREITEETAPAPRQREDAPEDTLRHMENMERRYAYENSLMQAVSQGMSHRAGMLMAGFSKLSFERRLADPVRNLKNYCIIMNTLLRKAAENGGVHPLYLDRMSSAFAAQIEALTSTEAVSRLMEKMYREYCRLVKKHATGRYSLPVQKAILHIESDLEGDLSLKALSEYISVNSSYLSTLFKKETGKTVTDYVNEKRVRRAMHLLTTSRLQVQTVAVHCGIPDVNYFGKIFKKYTGKTPKNYRRDIQVAPATGKDGG